MSLPACQERILSGIENALRKGEPRLASRFAIFTRLTSGEELPRTEQLLPQPWLWWWLKTVVRAWRIRRHRSRPAGPGARNPGQPVARLRSMIGLPVILIAIGAALFFAGAAAPRTCAPITRTPAAAAVKLGACTVSGTAAHPVRTGAAPAHSSGR